MLIFKAMAFFSRGHNIFNNQYKMATIIYDREGWRERAGVHAAGGACPGRRRRRPTVWGGVGGVGSTAWPPRPRSTHHGPRVGGQLHPVETQKAPTAFLPATLKRRSRLLRAGSGTLPRRLPTGARDAGPARLRGTSSPRTTGTHARTLPADGSPPRSALRLPRPLSRRSALARRRDRERAKLSGVLETHKRPSIYGGWSVCQQPDFIRKLARPPRCHVTRR